MKLPLKILFVAAVLAASLTGRAQSMGPWSGMLPDGSLANAYMNAPQNAAQINAASMSLAADQLAQLATAINYAEKAMTVLTMIELPYEGIELLGVKIPELGTAGAPGAILEYIGKIFFDVEIKDKSVESFSEWCTEVAQEAREAADKAQEQLNEQYREQQAPIDEAKAAQEEAERQAAIAVQNQMNGSQTPPDDSATAQQNSDDSDDPDMNPDEPSDPTVNPDDDEPDDYYVDPYEPSDPDPVIDPEGDDWSDPGAYDWWDYVAPTFSGDWWDS